MMIPRMALWMATLALLALPHGSAAGAPKESVTVVLKNGVRHEHVLYRVVFTLNLLELRSGKEVARVSFSDVEAVFDAQGDNIAPRLLGSRYRPLGDVAPGRGEARLPGTIVLKSGERFDVVHYRVDPVRRELTIPDGPQPRTIPWDSVGTIQDTEGRDITASRSPPAPPAELPPRPPRLWRVALVLDHGFNAAYDGAFKPGDHKSYALTRGGFGTGGAAYYNWKDDIALRASVSNLGVHAGPLFGRALPDSGFTIVSQHHSIDMTRFQVGVTGFRQIKRRNALAGFGYGHASIGIIRERHVGTVTRREISTGETITVESLTHDSRFALSVGAGVVFLVMRHVGFTVSGAIDFLFVPIPPDENGVVMFPGTLPTQGVTGIHGGVAFVR